MTAATNPPSTAQDAVEKKASGSSFYAAMRILPKAEREAMFAIYAFCRAVDDIADDGEGSRGERHAALEKWRGDLTALYDGRPPMQATFLREYVLRYGLRLADFLAVIDGMDMDVAENIRAPDWSTLDLYCDHVASAVGRLSVKVFGMNEQDGFELAHHLGRALQLTNILRDLDEDAAIGRLYLPREALQGAGITANDPMQAIATPLVDEACRDVAARAQIHYREVSRMLAARPGGRLTPPRLMVAVYGRILGKMLKQGWAPPRQRASVSKPELLYLLARHGVFG